ncbi:hypothetical protein C8T65DRAFT_579815, partial [Cerioporus squamosus]
PYERLKQGVQLKDGPLMLEYCLRRLALCELPRSPDTDFRRIVGMLEDLTGFQNMPAIANAGGRIPHINNSTPLLRHRALAACAWVYFEGHFSLPTGGSMHAITTHPVMENAAAAADVCVREDWHPRIANWLNSLRYRYPGLRNPPMRRVSEMSHLWSAYLAYKERRLKAQAKEWFEVEAVRNVYLCTAEGCHIQAIHKNAFRACGGNCPPETKPHYCSKLCQEKVSTLIVQFGSDVR